MPQFVLLRDDDTCYFTRPEQLERIYGRLWQAGIPVTVGLVPAMRGDTRVRHRVGAPYDPSIDKMFRGTKRAYLVADNVALCDDLHRRVFAEQVEIALHGYHHSYMECAYLQTPGAYALINQGRSVLEKHLPGLTIRSFIAPYDALSLEALFVAQTLGMSVCTSTRNIAKAFPDLNSYQAIRTPFAQALVTCDEYLFTHRGDPEQLLDTALARLDDEAVQVLTVANHYWMFFHDWADENSPLLSAWDRFVDVLLERDDLTFTTLGQLAPLL